MTTSADIPDAARYRGVVLPNMLPEPRVADLKSTGKRALTCGGRYWVRTSDLFGVNQVPSSSCAGQILFSQVKARQAQTGSPCRTLPETTSAPRAPRAKDLLMRSRADVDVPAGWPFFPSYNPLDPDDYLPAPARASLPRRLGAFTALWLAMTGAWSVATMAVLILSGGSS